MTEVTPAQRAEALEGSKTCERCQAPLTRGRGPSFDEATSTHISFSACVAVLKCRRDAALKVAAKLHGALCREGYASDADRIVCENAYVREALAYLELPEPEPTVVPRSVAMGPTDANGSAVEETP